MYLIYACDHPFFYSIAFHNGDGCIGGVWPFLNITTLQLIFIFIQINTLQVQKLLLYLFVLFSLRAHFFWQKDFWDTFIFIFASTPGTFSSARMSSVSMREIGIHNNE